MKEILKIIGIFITLFIVVTGLIWIIDGENPFKPVHIHDVELGVYQAAPDEKVVVLNYDTKIITVNIPLAIKAGYTVNIIR